LLFYSEDVVGSSANTSGSQPNPTGSSSSDGPATESKSTHQNHNIGLIIGSVVGGLFLLAILILLLLFMWRRKIYSSRDGSDAHQQNQPSSPWWLFSFRTARRSSSSSTFNSPTLNPSVVTPYFFSTIDTSERSSLRKSSSAARVQHSSPVLAPLGSDTHLQPNEESQAATGFRLPLSRGAADLPPSYTEN